MDSPMRPIQVFDPAFENFEFTQALSEALGPLVPMEHVPIHMATMITGETDFGVATNDTEAVANHEIDDTLSDDAMDPLERGANRQRVAEHTHSLVVNRNRQRTAACRAQEARRAGIQEALESPWEDEAGIAGGATISFREYGSHADLYQNSSLAEPELVPAPPSRPCRRDEVWTQEYQFPSQEDYEEEAEKEEQESAKRLRRELRADELYKKLREHQKGRLPLFKTLRKQVEKWAVDDSEASDAWVRHFNYANLCSLHKVRIWSIVAWYKRDVPTDIETAAVHLMGHHMIEAILARDLRRHESHLAVEPPRYSAHPTSIRVGRQMSDDDY